ncbi:MAG TPA: hypothetical protein VNA69_16100 [Thermoanaerobaculia bacterium]|nr:hypothetical protein [Thermoanaerobaculia bacterium]
MLRRENPPRVVSLPRLISAANIASIARSNLKRAWPVAKTGIATLAQCSASARASAFVTQR